MTTDMTDYRLPNSGQRDVEFTGELLGEVSTADGRKERWSESRIYRTKGGKYVAEKVGRTTRQNETDTFTVVVADTPEDLVAKVFVTPREAPDKPYIPNYVFDSLSDAGDKDPAIAAALIQKVD